MDGVSLWNDSGVRELGAKNHTEVRMLRSQLINLTLDWELEALSLDAQRYRTIRADERDNLRESALAYRRCITKVNEVLNSSPILSCRGAR